MEEEYDTFHAPLSRPSPPPGGGAKKLHAGNLQKLEMLTSSTEAWMNKLHSTI